MHVSLFPIAAWEGDKWWEMPALSYIPWCFRFSVLNLLPFYALHISKISFWITPARLLS